ncbi:MAG: Rieske 2Fe-2S domain-containing protein [Myxococcota bacterium]|nr:Rieske 2Fe-2S domain-containing protein [Myxococcota bacterium]
MSATRRGFMKGGAASAGVMAASLCAGCSVFLKRSQPDLSFPVGQEVISLPLAEHPGLSEPHGVTHLVSEDQRTRVIVVRGGDGTLVALAMECTHWGSDVRYRAASQRLECPSHGSVFDLTGQVVEGPADEPLRRYAVTENGGVVEVRLS